MTHAFFDFLEVRGREVTLSDDPGRHFFSVEEVRDQELAIGGSFRSCLDGDIFFDFYAFPAFWVKGRRIHDVLIFVARCDASQQMVWCDDCRPDLPVARVLPVLCCELIGHGQIAGPSHPILAELCRTAVEVNRLLWLVCEDTGYRVAEHAEER